MMRRVVIALTLTLALTASAAVAAPPVKPRTGARPKATVNKPAAPARRLGDVHIEGEMPLPQVLFITARDQRRYVDFQHARYLRDSRALAAGGAKPVRVATADDDRHE